MPTSSPTPVLPGEPAWDITFTRLTRLVLPGLEACMQRLAGRFQAMGLGCDTRVAQTPRGVSVFLALLGPRGLIGIVDMTLVDGQALGQAASPTAALVPWAALDLRLLDACAAPGGKTAHLLELADCDVTALDIDARRCERIHQNLSRLGLQARVVAADARDPELWWPENGRKVPYDGILLDAPCTASGIVRRHPDVRWLRRESDIGQLAIIQAALLSLLWPLVRPGGRLLYCTCSVFRAEGELQIQTFLAHNTDAALSPSPGHLIPRTARKGDPVRDNGLRDHDGFFYALLEKRAD